MNVSILWFDLATQTWDLLPRDPLGGATPIVTTTGAGTGGVFAHGEALFWAKEGMVAWNPVTRTWRTPAAPPRPHEHRAVWTGSAVLFPLDGLAYDPVLDRWRELARPAPTLASSANFGPSMVWVDGRVVVVGATAGVYDAAADRWLEFAAPPFRADDGIGWDAYTSIVFVVDGRIVAVDAYTSGVLDPVRGEWSFDPAVRPPVAPCEGATTAFDFEGGLLVKGGCSGIWRAIGGRWVPVPDPHGALYGSGTHVFAYGDGVLSLYEPDR